MTRVRTVVVGRYGRGGTPVPSRTRRGHPLQRTHEGVVVVPVGRRGIGHASVTLFPDRDRGATSDVDRLESSDSDSRSCQRRVYTDGVDSS